MPLGSLPWFGSVRPKHPTNSPQAETPLFTYTLYKYVHYGDYQYYHSLLKLLITNLTLGQIMHKNAECSTNYTMVQGLPSAVISLSTDQ
jgi:hypothetical protein